jgi:Fe-S-cluster containining protein
MARRLLADPDQRFTCQGCGRCCRRGWDIALTPAEVAAYRKGRVERFFLEGEERPAGAAGDPFEPIPGHAPFERIRRRRDGACGFLSSDNRCRLHEELGADHKPLSCQVFPFEFAPSGEVQRVVASFACPTIVANSGVPVATQLPALEGLHRRWTKVFSETPHPLAFAPDRPIAGSTVGSLKGVLKRLVDGPDLRTGIGQMARFLDDLSRARVLSLPPEAFAEYLEIMGRHATESPLPALPPSPGPVTRLLFRGFLFAVMATKLRLDGGSSGDRPGLRRRTASLLAHLHGIGPGPRGTNLRALGRAQIPLRDPAVRSGIHHHLRSSIEALGTKRPSILEEFGVSVAVLNAGLVLAAVHAGERGSASGDASDLAWGLTTAADITHAGDRGLFGRFVGTLSGSASALNLLFSGRFLGKEIVVYDTGVAAER